MKRLKSFQLGPHTIRVHYCHLGIIDPDDKKKTKEILGLFKPVTNELFVSTCVNGEMLCEDQVHHNVHHELAHAICILMNRWDLNSDETFIDILGMFLAHYDKSKTFID